MPKYSSVEEYLSALPEDVREVVAEIRRRVLRVVPDARDWHAVQARSESRLHPHR